jgi:endonuclease/exonuclease/phosphatase family metal-dependent hydrolase
MIQKILFSNIGYAKGIDGSLFGHLRYFHRHFYSGAPTQRKVLQQLRNIIHDETPDLCCFVEIDSGSFQSAGLNQMHELTDDHYSYYDISHKYGENSLVSRLPMHGGNSNGFISKSEIKFEKLSFRYGTKRLIYRMNLDQDTVLYFAHFSLNRKVRIQQFREVHDLLAQESGEVILLADFNILHGFSELNPLLIDTGLKLLNREEEHTFTFHRQSKVLDLCLCTPGIHDRLDLKIIPQPYSDHAALLVDIRK